jgi:hypothetical protein
MYTLGGRCLNIGKEKIWSWVDSQKAKFLAFVMWNSSDDELVRANLRGKIIGSLISSYKNRFQKLITSFKLSHLTPFPCHLHGHEKAHVTLPFLHFVLSQGSND